MNVNECPICYGENGCAAGENVQSCWCMTRVISQQARKQVPTEAIDKQCICQACAEKYSGIKHVPTSK